MQSSLRDLATEEAKRRLAQYGSNIITQERGVPLWRKFIANLTNFFAVLLWSVAALSFPTRGNESGVAIIEVILINAFFSFYQEYRAEQAVAALQKLLPAIAKVRRNGEVTQVQAAELVPGDILVLEEGDNITADVVAAITGGDKDNLVIALQARNKFHMPRIIARVNNPKNA